MKALIGLFIASAILLAGCVQPSASPTPAATATLPPATSTPISTPVATPISTSTPIPPATVTATATATPAPTVQMQEFHLTVKQWVFTPSTITVKKGIPVRITIESLDVTHGFGLTSGGINVNTQESPGSPGTVEFTPMETGSFTFRCTVFCGAGHGTLTGTLIVTD